MSSDPLLSIGEFSKVSGLSVKTLRFYHERELIVPVRVETGSGYRYYDQRNLETASIIVALKALEFSLDEIEHLIKQADDEEDVLERLRRRRAEVTETIRNQKSILSQLDQVIRQETENRKRWVTSECSIECRDLSPMLVAGFRMCGRYSDVGQGFAKLGRKFGRHIDGPAMCLYFDAEYREEDANFEPCFPIRRAIKSDEFSVRELPGGTALCLKHFGSYETLGRSYAKLFSHARQQEREPTCPSREVFLKGPGAFFKGNPKKYVTEIQLLVE